MGGGGKTIFLMSFLSSSLSHLCKVLTSHSPLYFIISVNRKWNSWKSNEPSIDWICSIEAGIWRYNNLTQQPFFFQRPVRQLSIIFKSISQPLPKIFSQMMAHLIPKWAVFSISGDTPETQVRLHRPSDQFSSWYLVKLETNYVRFLCKSTFCS